MKQLFIVLWVLFFVRVCTGPCFADTKIGDLPLGFASTTGVNDSFPYVNAISNTTMRLKLSDLLNLPTMQSQFSLMIPSQSGKNGNCLQSNGSNTFWTTCTALSSIGLSDNSGTPIYTVGNSPLTSSGTLTLTLKTELANLVFAGPTTGSAAQPAFRSLVGADLPNPSGASLGGIQSHAAVTHQWLNTISTSGVPASTQPACADLSNSSASCSTDATNASNISSGTLPAARLPNPSATTLGGVESYVAVTHQFLTTISTLGVLSSAQPACSDLSNAVASCSTDATNAANISSGTLPAARLPNPTASTLGGVESLTAVTHNFLTSISTSGVPTQAQPACGDLSNAAASCSTDTTNATNITTGTLGSTVQGNITSVGTIATGTWAGTAVAANHGGTGLTSGTSGGIPYFSGTTTIASSGALTAHQVVLGGGAGATPYVVSGTGTSTQILTSNGASADPTWQDAASATGNNSSAASTNLGAVTSVSGSALTIALKQKDGSTDPASGSGAVTVGIHGTTAGTASFNLRSVTSALSFTISSGTTLNFRAAKATNLYLYLVDSDGAGAMKLAASVGKLDDNQLYSTVAESFSATATNASPAVFTATAHGLVNNQAITLTGTPPTGFSTATVYYIRSVAANTFQLALNPSGTSINSSSTGSSIVVHMADGSLVSDAVYTTKPIRLFGYAQLTEATPGTWATNAAAVGVGVIPNPSFSMSAAYGNNCTFNLTSATYTDYTADSSCTFTILDSNNLNVAAWNNGTAGTQLNGYVLCPPSPGSWHFTSTSAVLDSVGSEAQSVQLTDVANTSIDSYGSSSIAGDRIPMPLAGDFNPATWPACTVIKIQGASATGQNQITSSGSLGNGVNWSAHWNGY